MESRCLGWNPKADSNQITEYYENIKNYPPFASEDGEVTIPLEIFKVHFKNLSKEFLLENSQANAKPANSDASVGTMAARIGSPVSYTDTQLKASETEAEMPCLLPDGVITVPQIQGTFHQLGNALMPFEKLYVALALPSGFTPDDVSERVDWWKLTEGGNNIDWNCPCLPICFAMMLIIVYFEEISFYVQFMVI